MDHLDGTVEAMIARVDERTINILDLLKGMQKSQEKLEKRISGLEQNKCPNHADVELSVKQLKEDINKIRLEQEKNNSDSNLEDEKIRSKLKVTSAQVAGITTIALILISRLFESITF